MGRFFIGGLFALLACSGRGSDYEKFQDLKTLMRGVGVTPQSEQYMIMIIPANGCDNCIDEVIEFAFLRSYQDSIYFVLTGRSKREINLRVGPRERPGWLYYDTAGSAFSNNLCTNFPVLFSISKNEVASSVEINGQNVYSALKGLTVPR